MVEFHWLSEESPAGRFSDDLPFLFEQQVQVLLAYAALAGQHLPERLLNLLACQSGAALRNRSLTSRL